jgi:TatD DNase family protein
VIKAEFFDTHCHLDFDVFDDDLAQLFSACAEQGVNRFLIPATDVVSFDRIQALIDSYKRVYAAAGIHPFFVSADSVAKVSKVHELLAAKPKNWLAVGEIGLDKMISVDYGLQLEVFRAQLVVAESLSLPVILHCRKSDAVMLQELDRYQLVGGIVHAFSGSYEIACEFLKRGFKLGLGGVVTWQNAVKVKAMVERLGFENYVLETDAPDMRPQGMVDTRNTPLTVVQVARRLAELWGCDVETVAKHGLGNANKILNI